MHSTISSTLKVTSNCWGFKWGGLWIPSHGEDPGISEQGGRVQSSVWGRQYTGTFRRQCMKGKGQLADYWILHNTYIRKGKKRSYYHHWQTKMRMTHLRSNNKSGAEMRPGWEITLPSLSMVILQTPAAYIIQIWYVNLTFVKYQRALQPIR